MLSLAGFRRKIDFGNICNELSVSETTVQVRLNRNAPGMREFFFQISPR